MNLRQHRPKIVSNETRAERMDRLRYEQRCAYHGKPVKKKRIVGKPSKQKSRQRKNRGPDAFFHSTNVGSIG